MKKATLSLVFINDAGTGTLSYDSSSGKIICTGSCFPGDMRLFHDTIRALRDQGYNFEAANPPPEIGNVFPKATVHRPNKG